MNRRIHGFSDNICNPRVLGRWIGCLASDICAGTFSYPNQPIRDYDMECTPEVPTLEVEEAGDLGRPRK
jgi:hypothetical protein